jgi:hypothetical protein
VNTLKNEIQNAFESGIAIEDLVTKYGKENVDRYVNAQLCVNCEEKLYTCFDRQDEQVCDECHRMSVTLEGMPAREASETDNDYWKRVGEYAASLNDSDVADFERDLENDPFYNSDY